MASFRYRAIDGRGKPALGEIQASDRPQALAAVRRLGVVPLELAEIRIASRPARGLNGNKAKAAAAKTIGEIGVLLKAGLPLDRALALSLENIEHAGVLQVFQQILLAVREGQPLSRALAGREALFPASALAMIEAGEANGGLDDAMARVAAMFAQAEEMRRLIVGALIYPASLLILAVAVILLMLLYVVPQFESLFDTARTALPASSRMLMAASRALRADGLVILGVVVAVALVVRQMLRRPTARMARDRLILRVPQLGTLVRYIETARLARALGNLVQGGVPLPTAMAMAVRAIGNRVMADAIGDVAARVKEGGGLTGPLAATRALPRLAIGFFRTGEETSQLGMMLEKLADVLDRDVTQRLERLVAIATPLITVSLGGAVAAIIASIMTAILGFDDLAVTQ